MRVRDSVQLVENALLEKEQVTLVDRMKSIKVQLLLKILGVTAIFPMK